MPDIPASLTIPTISSKSASVSFLPKGRISGESSFNAAKRELFEELGITSNEETLKQIFRLKRRNSFLDVWFIEADAEITSLKLQESEVAEAKWISRDELQKMIKTGHFHNYGREYFQKLFESTDLLRGAVL